MKARFETLSPEASSALYTINSIDQGDITAVKMTEAPYAADLIPDVRRSTIAGTFFQATMTADFIEKNPRAGEYLVRQGLSFSLERQLDGGKIIDIRYPNPRAYEPNPDNRFRPVPESVYSSRDFMDGLRSGVVIQSSNQDSDYELHDNITHRAMWELVITAPGLFEALGNKADKTLEELDALPPRDPNLWGPEENDLAIARATVHNRLEVLMGTIDFQISTSAYLAIGITNGKLSMVSEGLRDLFSTPDGLTHSPSVPDATINDEQINAWAKHLVDHFSNAHHS